MGVTFKLGEPVNCNVKKTNVTFTIGGVQVDSSKIIATPPATSTSNGTAGQIAFDDDFGYFCVSNDKWKRWALESNWDD